MAKGERWDEAVGVEKYKNHNKIHNLPFPCSSFSLFQGTCLQSLTLSDTSLLRCLWKHSVLRSGNAHSYTTTLLAPPHKRGLESAERRWREKGGKQNDYDCCLTFKLHTCPRISSLYSFSHTSHCWQLTPITISTINTLHTHPHLPKADIILCCRLHLPNQQSKLGSVALAWIQLNSWFMILWYALAHDFTITQTFLVTIQPPLSVNSWFLRRQMSDKFIQYLHIPVSCSYVVHFLSNCASSKASVWAIPCMTTSDNRVLPITTKVSLECVSTSIVSYIQPS